MEIDGNAPATKGDIIDLRNEVCAALTSELSAAEARLNERHEMLRAEMDDTHADLKETMRDVQTELLKAFYSFGQSNSKRIAEVEGNESALRSRVATLEDRVMEIEKRLNIPPIH